MKLVKSFFGEIFVFELKIFNDTRGHFYEILRTEEISKAIGKKFKIKQANISFSKKNVFRGLHYQKLKKQHKIIFVNTGAIIDYFLCINKKSKNYLKFGNYKLSEKSKHLIFIHNDYAHGFLSLKENTSVTYFTSDIYDKESETGINPLDPNLELKLPKKIILSNKDRNLPFLK